MHWEESSCGGELFLSYLTEGHRRVDAFQTHLCPLAQKSRERKQQQEKKKKRFFLVWGLFVWDLGFFHVGQEKNLQSGSDWHLLVSVRFPCCPGQPNNNVLSTRGKTQDCNLASELEDITFPMCLRLTRKLYNL